MTTVILLLIGLVTGVLTGLTGASGMSVLISALLFMGRDIREIIALTYFVTFANSISASAPYWKQKNIPVRETLVLSVPSLLGVALGFNLSYGISSDLIRNLMVAALFAIGIKLIANKKKEPIGRTEKLKYSPVLLAIIGLAFGILMGVFGGGGGLFIAIILMWSFKFPAKQAIGASICVMGFAALPGIVLHINANTMSLSTVAYITGSSVFASYFAARFSNKINEELLKMILGCYLLFMASALVIKTFL